MKIIAMLLFQLFMQNQLLGRRPRPKLDPSIFPMVYFPDAMTGLIKRKVY